MIAALATGALALCPGHLPPLSRASPITLRLSPAVMQFDDVTKRAAPPAQKAESPEDDDAGVEGGVRALGFLVGGLTGNFALSIVEALTNAPTPTTGTVAQVAMEPLKTDGLYNAVLPLFESGVIPKLSLPGFAGGDTIRAVNSRANEKYGFMFPAAEAPPPAVQPAVEAVVQPVAEAVVQPVAEAAAGPSGPGSLPDDGMTQLQQLQQQLQQLQQLQQQQQQQLQQQQDAGSAALSQLQDTGSSALNQLAAALSPLPQPAHAAHALPPLATPPLGGGDAAASLATPLASSLDGASFALASGGGGVGLLAHLLVPLLCGVLGAVGFDALAKQEGAVAGAIKGGGKLVGQAGQALWASVQGDQQVPAGNAGSPEVPARRRMPWEEDGDLQRQWEEEQKGPR